MAVETELRRAVKGTWPPPHIIMDRLLQLGIPMEKCEFKATDSVLLKYGQKQKEEEKKKNERSTRFTKSKTTVNPTSETKMTSPSPSPSPQPRELSN